MPSLPVEVLLGIYLGLLTGIVPAFVAGSLGFLVRYFTGVTLPGFGVAVLALSIASVQGGILGLVEPSIAQSPRLLVAVLVVLMLAMYAHNQGDRLGAELPRRLSLRSLRERTLSADVVEFVGAVGQVTVRPAGPVRDLQGYPPLPHPLRSTLTEGSWRLPADLPLSELERRLEERLRTDHDLADVSVTLDEHGRATIAAAPPSSGLSRRVPDGHRAVSLEALVPTGLARGDRVVVATDSATVSGTVLSVRAGADEPAAGEAVTDGGDVEPAAFESPTEPTGTATAGGEGRVTVAVPRREARTLLASTRGRVIVQSRATSPEFEALSLLKRAGYAVRRVTVGPGGWPDEAADPEPESDGAEPSASAVRTVAVRRRGTDADGRRREWTFAPGIEGPLEPGDEAFVIGPERVIDRLAEAIE